MTDRGLLAGYRRLPVTGLHSIAHLVPANGRCGIYVLGFGNGDRYVGQAVDVTARFGAHRRTWPGEIVEVAFRRVPRAHLSRVEQDEIARLHHAGVALRNVVHMPGRLGASAFDELVSPEDQQHWLSSPRQHTPHGGARPEQPQQRHRLRPRYTRLVADPRFPPLRDLLHRYVTWTVPLPRRTELSYWALSALPSTNATTYPRLFTVSVQQLETLFVCAAKGTPEQLHIRLNVDLPTLGTAWGDLDQLAARTAGFDLDLGGYGRPDVASLQIYSPRDALRVLSMRGVVAAARRLNLDLMRKGPTTHWRTHCFDLADLALDPPTADRRLECA